MELIKRIIAGGKAKGLSDYFQVYKEIEKEKIKRKIHTEKTIKIALLSSFTTTGIREALSVKCLNLGIMPDFYAAPYNQYAHEILDKDSFLYKFKPDLTIVFVDTMTLLGEAYFFPYRLSETQRKVLVDEKYRYLKGLIDALSECLPGKIIFHNFQVPPNSPLGILENKQRFGFLEMIKSLNAKLTEGTRESNQVFIFDYEGFCSKHGKCRIWNHKMYYLGDIKIDFDFVPFLCEEYIGYIKPIMSLTKKCVVLDLDNVLWGGIAGEDGLEGIRLGPTSEGRPFLDFQRYILNLFERGVMLAVNSHNNQEDVLRIFREHPYMLLKEGHFAAMCINWEDKVSNMKAISEKINIGLDSMVFIDDNKLNREMVKGALPEVLIVELPEDPALYAMSIMEINDFNALHLTDEDARRGHMYAQQRKRDEYKKGAVDIDQYLKGLEMVVTIERASAFNIPRVAQLTQKTNQFNVTTKRYFEDDIERFAQDPNFIVVSVKVEDKFGDNGITGAAIVKKERKDWMLDTFLLSCRVIGRRIEDVMLAYILEEARRENICALIGEFIPTKKNIPAKDFYRNRGFRIIKTNGENQIWQFEVARDFRSPEFIRVVKKD